MDELMNRALRVEANIKKMPKGEKRRDLTRLFTTFTAMHRLLDIARVECRQQNTQTRAYTEQYEKCLKQVVLIEKYLVFAKISS